MKQIVFILLLVFSLFAKAQPPKKFHCKYGGNGYDVGYDVKQTLDKGYIITGSTSSFGQGNTDLYLLKLDSMGQVKFETSFGGYSNDIGQSVIQLSDSSYIMTGYTSSTGIGGYDIFLVKADKNGTLVWQKTIGGSDWDFAHSMQQTSDGGFIIAGTTYSFGYGNADGYIVKTDANGNVTWSKTYGGKKDDEFKSVIETVDGKFALTGYSKSYSDSLGDTWLFKIETNGDSLRCNFFGGQREDFGNDIIQDNLGNYYIAGAIDSLKPGYLDSYALKINSFGILVWKWEDGYLNTNDSYNSVVLSGKNSGYTVYSQTETFTGYGIHIKLMELNSLGYYNSATEYGDILADEILKITSTSDKGYIGVGYTNNYGAKLTDVYLLKLDTTLLGSISIVSVNEIIKNNFEIEIYPNPASKDIIIKSSISFNADDLKLFDAIGNELLIKDKIIPLEKDNKIINVEEFSSGIYYLKLFNKTTRISIIH
ncbi:MAG: T9SS type A sorting domain-containing protein [Burkholderiales bacterium]|nr:T9SS type A sorting domain-containing protein [Bacteroidia bacterium]